MPDYHVLRVLAAQFRLGAALCDLLQCESVSAGDEADRAERSSLDEMSRAMSGLIQRLFALVRV